MAVTEGRNAKVTVTTTATGVGNQTIAELGTWNISGIARDLIETTAFGDTVKKFKVGMLNAGQVTFSGQYDPSDSSGQAKIIQHLSSGVAIDNTTTRSLCKLRLWPSGSTSAGSTAVYGFWSATNSSGELFVTSMETGTDKNGVGTVSFTAQVSKGALEFSTST